MKRGLLLVAIVVPLFGCKSSPKSPVEPGLQETITWMHNFAADEGSGAVFDGNGCSAKITWLFNDNPDQTFSFSFTDLDPILARSVQTIISPPAAYNMWRATAVTTNNAKKVEVYSYRTKEREQDTVIQGIPFRNSDAAGSVRPRLFIMLSIFVAASPRHSEHDDL